MTEVSFARTFLAALDSRPITIPSDHIEDLRRLPPDLAYTLPKNPSAPIPKRRLPPSASSASPTSSSTTETAQLITVYFSALRTSPATSAYLPLQRNLPLTTTILDLKQLVSDASTGTAGREHGKLPLEKIKLLYSKRPMGEGKTVKDVFKGRVEEGMEVGVMIIGDGGGASLMNKTVGMKTEEVGRSSTLVLAKDDFWTDLRAWLMGKIGDEMEADRVEVLFRKAWRDSGN